MTFQSSVASRDMWKLNAALRWAPSNDLVNVLERGVAGDGSTDDTDAINEVIASAPDGSTILFPGGRTYSVSSAVRLCGKRDYVMWGATLRQRDQANYVGSLVVSDGWWTDGLKVSAPGAEVFPQADYPINVFGGTIDGNERNQDPAAITNGLTLRCFWSSVYGLVSKNLTGEGIQPSDLGRLGNRLAPTQTCVEQFYERCQIRNCGGPFGFHQVDSGHSQVTDGFIKDLIVQGRGPANGSGGILLDHAAGWLVQGCHVYGLGGVGIKALNCFGTRLAHNYVEAYGQSDVAPVAGMAGIFCSGNTGYGTTLVGNNVVLKAADLVPGGLYRGIQCSTNTKNKSVYALSGNTAVLTNPEQIALAALCDPYRITNQDASAESIYAFAGNADSGWSTTGLQTTAVGKHVRQS